MAAETRRYNGLPRQTIPNSQKKNIKWIIDNVEAIEGFGGSFGSRIRVNQTRKRRNFRLWDGHVDKNEILKFIDPDNIMDGSTTTEIVHHPILLSKFNVLIGEEFQRSFQPVAMVSNPTAVSEKEEKLNEVLKRRIMQILSNPELTDDQKMQLMDKYRKELLMSFQDQREVRANRIIRYLFQDLRLKHRFNDGFKNALISAEEIYDVNPVAGKPHCEVLDPRMVYTLMDGNSNRIEDADIIVIESYRSMGQIIDRHHKKLTTEQIKQLETENPNMAGISNDPMAINRTPEIVGFALDADDPVLNQRVDLTQALFSFGTQRMFGPTFDASGNVRELKVLWRSRKRVKRVFTPNPVTGKVDEIYMPEDYVVNTDIGEQYQYEFVNWWFEAYKIGDNIYYGGPKEIQYTRLNDPSYCSPGIVGKVYNTNNARGVSLMDRTYMYQVLYDLVWDRLRDAMVSWWGPIMEIDMAKKPNKWSFDKWIFYAKRMKLMVVDSFSTPEEGRLQGKLAGTFNTTGKMLYSDVGNYIQQLVNILSFIEVQIAIVTGVTKQREGQTKERETATGIQQSLIQSTSITEPLFMEHEEVKLEVVRTLVETAKYVWKDKKFQAQYTLDNGSLDLFDVDGDAFADADYDIHIVDGASTRKIEETMIQLGQAALQNDKASFSALMDMFISANGLAEKRSIIRAEEERQQQSIQEQRAHEQEIIDKQLRAQELEQDKARMHEIRRDILNNNTKIEVALIDAEKFGYVENSSDIESLVQTREKLMTEMKKLDEDIKDSEMELMRLKNKKKKVTQSNAK